VVALAGLVFIAMVVANAGRALDPSTLIPLLIGTGVVSLVVGLLVARYIVRAVAGGLERIARGIEEGRLADPRSVGIVEWGEMGWVGRHVREMLEVHREFNRSRTAFAQLHAELDRARLAIERWIASERWEPIAPVSPELSGLVEALHRGVTRQVEVADQNLEAARLVREQLAQVIEDAHQAARLAEHGYIEATALMTTLAEFARLATELQPALAAPAETNAAEVEWRTRAASALEELIEVSSQSVSQLSEGLSKVQEIGGQVQLLSNRATLIALDAIVGASRSEVGSTRIPVAELKQLAAEVRAANERVSQLSADVERVAGDANARMSAVRASVLERLEAAGTPAQAAPPSGQVVRLVARLREMVRDAGRKGERLSESSEQASSASQHVARLLEEELQDVDGLIVRLTPTGISTAPSKTQEVDAAPRAPRRLRVLEGQTPDDEPQAGREERP
jgi:methyl-accepting chemotaxis protein